MKGYDEPLTMASLSEKKAQTVLNASMATWRE
jgi:hypothetical protein